MSTTRTPPSKVYIPGPSGSNPFDSDSDSNTNYKPARAASASASASAPATSKVKYNSSQPINGHNGGRATASPSVYSNYASRKKYKDDFRDSGGTENQSIQELEGYDVYKAEETTQKGSPKVLDDDGDFAELYEFKWMTLLIPPTTVLFVNLGGIVAGVSYATNSGYQSWGPLFGKLFFATWVIVHLYPFLKGLLGRHNRTPTIVIVWSILLASIFSLL